ncbi:MAG: carboxypeptidase regulatory-like domain-containing protein [Acidobacteriaceae bacterium]|nr:carboxypeptidase regulatory-like domain-containing protein [Acidobacteriaceae bacterium]
MYLVRSLCRTLAALAAIFCCQLAFAQSDLGSIAGFVRDPSGATIPNAKITIHNQTGLERTAASDASGRYTITNVPPGLYTMTADAPGFKKFTSTDNKLDPSAALELDAAMQVGSATETVEVSGTAQVLQTESAAVQSNVTRQQIDALELNGRNPIFMASLVPGARGGNLASLNFNFTQGPSNFNGSRNPENLITYDGAPATRTRSNGTSLGAADVDSTQEIQILTADYAAEYGRSSGGQIRILTRSGGTDFHGAAYEYVRNNVFNANTWLRNHTPDVPGLVPFSSVAPFRYNQYGYNIGGPFYIPGKFNKDKSKYFWYWGQEWVKYRFTDSAQWTVPSNLMRQGNFSELLNPNNIWVKGGVVIKDPNTGQPFPNNIIPSNRLSQNGLGILKAYPAPNLATAVNGNINFYVTALHPQDQRKDTLAVDINVTDNQRLQFRRMNYAFNEYQPLDGTPTETPKYFNRPNQTNSLDYVWTISPTIVNETLATVSLDDVYIPVDEAHFFDRTTAGINYPYIFPQGKLIQTRIPTANISNLTGLTGGPYPSHSSGPIYTFTDSLTWIKNNHTFKFGFYFERSGENDNDEINVNACSTCTNNQNGQFQFTDTRSGAPNTGNAIANAAMGLFDSYSELGQRAYTLFRGSSYEPYAQDSWKATQKLTITYGVRYTIIKPYSATWRNMAVFDPVLYDPSKAVFVSPVNGTVTVGNGDRYNGLVFPGNGFPASGQFRFPESTDPQYLYLFRNGKYPSYYSNIQWNDVQPRVGIAYQLNDKTVIRTGGGRFFTRLGVSDSIFLGGNPPFQPTANVTFGNADNPGGTGQNVLPLTVTTQSRTFKNPEAWNWNFTVERQLPWNSVASIGYVGRRGLHLQREADINQPTTATVAAARAANPTVNLDSLRPFKGYGSIRETDNVATSRYNSLQATWNRRFVNGFMFGASYTFSHSQDDGSAQRDVIPDTYYAGNLWGDSQFDVRHILTINYLYALPFFRDQSRLVGKILGGWQISGITQFQTGTACSTIANNDYAGVGQDGNVDGNSGNVAQCLGSSSGQFWAINGDPKVIGNIALNGATDPHYWFATTNSNGSPIFVQPSPGTFVTQNGVRNAIHNPGLANWNIGLYKKFAINERFGFQFRAEAFNAFNHPNWGSANFDPTSTTFGKVTAKTDDVRNLQLSLRAYF